MGGKGGGGSISAPNMGNISVQPSPYEASLAGIGNQLFTLTGPLRSYFMEDMGTFMRGPGGATPWMPGGVSMTGVNPGPGYAYTPGQAAAAVSGTTLPGGTTGGGGTSAGYTGPSYNDIYGNLKTAYTANDPRAVNEAASYLSKYGEPIGAQLNQPYYMTNDSTGAQVINPAFDPWLKSEAQRVFNAQVQKGMETIASQQQTGQAPTYGTGYGTPRMGGIGGNRYDPYQLPAFAPLYQLSRTGLESQYNPARENILASTPRGGALYNSLANLEMSRAQQAGALPASLAAPIIQDLYNKAYGIAWQTPQTSIAGLTGAEQGLASRYGSLLGAQASVNNAAMMAQAQQNALAAQSGAGLGAGLGSLLGMGLKRR